MKAVHQGCTQEAVQYMIDHHPGDPFREQAQYQKTLLATVVQNDHNYSIDFIEYVLNGYPEAAFIQETDKYKYTVLHFAACTNGKEDIFRLLLSAYPAGAFIKARRRELPLHCLTRRYRCFRRFDDLSSKNCVALVALANPKALFLQSYHKTDGMYSPFSILSAATLNPLDAFQRIEKELGWSYLFFFMNVYRFGKMPDMAKAWLPPQYPVHMGTSKWSRVLHVSCYNTLSMMRSSS